MRNTDFIQTSKQFYFRSVTHRVGTVYFPCKFSHKQWILLFERLLCLYLEVVFMERRFFAVLLVLFILAFDHFQKLVQRIVKQNIPSKPQ